LLKKSNKMIQRIQTLFLALVSASMIGFVMMPVWHKTSADGGQSVSFSATQLVHTQGIITNVTPVWYVAGLAVLVALGALFAIFQYRNRMRQALICAINSIMLTGVVGVTMYFVFGKAQKIFDTNEQGEIGIGFYALLAGLVFNFLANRAIRRDEKLVRSQDRMR
jgi:glucan phosphoethanolaminetransferase (alkaline phosphatase superfamily)